MRKLLPESVEQLLVKIDYTLYMCHHHHHCPFYKKTFTLFQKLATLFFSHCLIAGCRPHKAFG